MSERMSSNGNRVGLRKAGLALAVLALAGCASTTSEGSATASCIDGTADLVMEPGEKIRLGDLSSDEGFGQGKHNDWFEVRNIQGAIVYFQETGGSKSADDGEVEQTTRGFIYTENGNTYNAEFDNSQSGTDGNVVLTLITTCED